MRSRRLLPAVLAAGLVAVLGASPLAASPSDQIKAKQREAGVVLAQVGALDQQLNGTVESWDGARYRLGQVRKQLAGNRVSLRVAERARRRAQLLVARRLVTIYESDEPTTIDVVFGSSSLGDLIDRLQAEQSVAASDRQLAKHAAAARDRYVAARRTLLTTEQKRLASLQQLTSQRQQISAMLEQRRRLLSSVQGELVTMKAAEAKHQAALKAEAQRRLAAERATLARAAAAKKAADEAAAKAAAKAAAAKLRTAPATTPAPTTTAPATRTDTTPATTAPATTAPAVIVPPATTDPSDPTSTDPTTTDPTTTTDPVAPPAAPNTQPLPAGHPEAATVALRYLGAKYVWGGMSPSGFDCSGLVAYVYAQLGVSLPHYAAAQYQLGVAVPRDQLQPGDLVFFDGLAHVGIYIGGGQFVHAPHTGDVVKITSLAAYGPGYVGARRL